MMNDKVIARDRTVSQDPLFRPLTIKRLTLRNRFMSTSHACGLEEDGMPGEAYQRYHQEKARGGLALTMFGGSSNVAPDSPKVFRQLNVGVDRVIPYLRSLSERVHAEGAALMCQITHLGRRGEPYADNWLPTIAPSPIRETLHRSFPKEMDEHDISRVVAAYGAAAKRCEEGGLDGIETLAGGHLIGQFLSPRTNRRTDRFGGSLENRCRFGLMVHEAIRRAVGDDFLVGMRFVVDEGPGDGLGFDECLAAARIFEAAGAVDFFNAIYGKMDTARALAYDNMPGMDSPLAPWVAVVGEFRRAVGVPVFHAARIADIPSARYAIAEGLVDMVGMTRAHIADPHLVRKLAAGEEERIRPCVGATHCMSSARPSCLHNPATGRELKLPHTIVRAERPGRRAIVVGGGPAGLEAARVLAERGHFVTVHEAAPCVGGQVLIAAQASWRRDLMGVVDWRRAELERLGVTVHLNSYVEPEDVIAAAPDIVIVATGGTPDLDWLHGVEHATSVWDFLTGQSPARGEVLVYDGTGRHPAPQAVERAVAEGSRVTFASIDAEPCAELTYAERAAWKKRIYGADVKTIFDVALAGIEREGNRLTARLVNQVTLRELLVTVDHVVVEHGTVPVDEVYRGLRASASNHGVTDLDALLSGRPQPAGANTDGRFELHRIGDAVASRNIHTATLDALRLCMTM